MNLSEVYYDNALRNGTVTFSGPEVSGFESINSYDWRDFSEFLVPAGTTKTLDVVLSKAMTLDALIVWCAGVTNTVVTLQEETSPGVFTTRLTVNLAAAVALDGIRYSTGGPFAVTLGTKIRISIAAVGDAYFRQIFAGPRLQFPIGQYDGVTPPTLTHGIVSENVIALNGSVIGKNYRRIERSAAIDLEYLTASWVRSYWDAFALHMARRACFYNWSPALYPDDIAFAATDDINPPVNKGPPGRMSVSMKLKCLV